MSENERMWPESKVLALMELSFHWGYLNSALKDRSGRRIGCKRLWKMYKSNRIDPRLKYINPDKRCFFPVDLDEFQYCWEYGMKADKGEENMMNCKGCELFREEV